MENHELNVIFNKSGSGSISSKVSIPITDLRDMGISPENRKINYHYDKKTKTITLTKK